ncbi:MAG: Lrp/AsnC ligand binding domain-containing protein [Candidatus Heimdallarchaeota archaeon]|nr:MAG: Lrp/AsnC family transcriptional regulator [Candidatus Gerdarchaeota archaeon]RLI71591.1 MAG: Lrp/AsnC family transcriptional regulator [Candidatus Gerdarchaeota archaeon]RLI74051.1 MAG: Lrp/AsnC family transcriptional regulator [Candidatus Heimdallarchaeota archaeon]
MVEAYVLINVKGGSESELFEKLAKINGVEEIALVWGLFDIIMKIKAESANALDKLVSDEIRKYSNISSTMTMLIRQ